MLHDAALIFYKGNSLTTRYQPGTGASTCEMCDGGATCPPGSTRADEECDIGSVPSHDGNCILCEQGTYSVTKGAKECFICPPGARCCGEARVEVLRGYWSPPDMKFEITRCVLAHFFVGRPFLIITANSISGAHALERV